MTQLYKRNITNTVIKSPTTNTNDIVSDLVNKFYSEIVKPDDQKLFDIAFSKNPTQEDLNKFLKTWDIEVYGSGKSLMLSYLMKMHPSLKFSEYEAPRLAGLLNYFRFSNLNIIAHFTKVGKAINEVGIIPMILKGGAMKYIRPELPRVMGDIDILTIGKDFNTACEISKKLGYIFGKESTSHSVDLHTTQSNAGTVDIHRFLDFETDYNKDFLQDLYKRASKAKIFGVDCYLPCYEDMVFVALTNMAKNLYRNTSSQGMLYTLFDCKYLMQNKPDFNWNIVVTNALKSNTSVQIYFAMHFANKIVPNLLPEFLLKNEALEKKTQAYCNEVMFYRFYVHDLKMQCKTLKIKDALCNFEIMRDYINAKPKHWVLKRVNKSPILITVFLQMAKKLKERRCK